MRNLFAGELRPLLVLLVCIVVVIVISSILAYILGCIGMMKIAEKNGIDHGWLAWIPIANNYLMGEVAFSETSHAIAYFIVSFLSSACGVLTLPGLLAFTTFSGGSTWTLQFPLLLGFVAYVAWYIACYKIYKKMSTKAVLMLIFTIITSGAISPFFFFAIRKNDVINEDLV